MERIRIEEYGEIPTKESIEELLRALIESEKRNNREFTIYTGIKGIRSFNIMAIIDQMNSRKDISLKDKIKLRKLINSKDEEISDLGIYMYNSTYNKNK